MNKMFKRVLSMVLTASMVVLPFVQTVGEFTFFADEANATAEMRILTAILLTAITGSYALYLALSMKGKTND